MDIETGEHWMVPDSDTGMLETEVEAEVSGGTVGPETGETDAVDVQVLEAA